jgi:hypothetical protein
MDLFFTSYELYHKSCAAQNLQLNFSSRQHFTPLFALTQLIELNLASVSK